MTRYPIQANAWFQWLRPDGSLQACTGWTRDISGHGVFVVCGTVPTVGAAIEVAVNVPPTRIGEGIRLQIRGKGKVIRQVPDQGFAVELAFQIERTGYLSDRTDTSTTEAQEKCARLSSGDECLQPISGRGWSGTTQA